MQTCFMLLLGSVALIGGGLDTGVISFAQL